VLIKGNVMGLRLSTGLRNALLNQRAVAKNLITAATISFEVGSGTDARDRVVSASDDLSAFRKRQMVTVAGATEVGNNGVFEVLAVAAGFIEVAAASLTAEAASATITLAGADGGSLVDLFRNCVIDVFTGGQPPTADTAETGTKLVSITLSSGAFTGGVAANGLNFGNVAAGVLSKASGEVWSGVGVAAGTAGWFRCHHNDYTLGGSTSAIRFDGAASTSGGQLNMTNTAVAVGGTTTIDSVSLTLPAN